MNAAEWREAIRKMPVGDLLALAEDHAPTLAASLGAILNRLAATAAEETRDEIAAKHELDNTPNLDREQPWL